MSDQKLQELVEWIWDNSSRELKPINTEELVNEILRIWGMSDEQIEEWGVIYSD